MTPLTPVERPRPLALKIHILARRWSEPGQGERGVTVCGEPLFKSARAVVDLDNEWEAVRRIGGAVAVPEREFYPDGKACRKCLKKWEAGEV